MTTWSRLDSHPSDIFEMNSLTLSIIVGVKEKILDLFDLWKNVNSGWKSVWFISNDILLLLQFLSVRGTPPGVSTDLFSQLPNEHVKKWSPIVMEGRLDQFKFPQPERQRVKKTTLNAKNQQIKQKYSNHISFFAIGPPSGHVRITRLSSAEWTICRQ